MVLETADERRVNGVLSNPRFTPAKSGPALTQLALALDRFGSGQASLDETMDLLIAWTHQAVGTAEVVHGSERFYLDNGKVFHDDSFYHARTSYFFDHFIFERRLSAQAGPGAKGEGLTPAQFLLAESERLLPEAMAATFSQHLTALQECRHSLFQIAKVSDKAMVLVDLIRGGRLTITSKPQEIFRGLEKKTIIQAFVFPVAQTMQLSSGVVLHPAKASRLIKRTIKQQKDLPDFNIKATLARFATAQIRYLRHRHVQPKLIYQAVKG